MRRLLVAIAAASAFLAAGCSSGTVHAASHATAFPVRSSPDPRTTAALLKVATVFNNNYDNGNYGPVWDRWDARSQAVISKAGYVLRHKDCPNATHVTALVETAAPGPHGAWLVDYEISGEQLTDYWFYVRHNWVFDLVLSNPSSVRLYRMSPQRYAKAVGCASG